MYFKQDFNEKHFKATAAFQYRILLTYTLFECSNIEIITRLEYRIYILSFFPLSEEYVFQTSRVAILHEYIRRHGVYSGRIRIFLSWLPPSWRNRSPS